MNTKQTHNLPIKGNLTSLYAASLVVAVLTAAASVLGLVYRHLFYPTEALVQAFIPNDVVNLFIGLPILLGSLWAAWRGKLLGLLFWPGALFFGFYNSIAYTFALPFNWGFLLQLVLTILNTYTLVALVARIDGSAVKERLEGLVHERLSGGIITGFGLAFLLRVIIVVVNALLSGGILTEIEMAPNVSDAFISPALVIAGIALWKRHPLGYIGGLGLLFQASMLFVGLIAFMVLQPLLTSAPFALVDVVVVAVMGLVCFVPFGLFVRGVMRNKPSV